MKSDAIKTGVSRAPARAMLKATGLTDEDLKKPLVGIANTWTEAGPCNFHLRSLAEHVKTGVRKAGGTPIEFNTIVISDGIAMGTEAMKASLVSREVVADSIELAVRGHGFDAVLALVGCDKTIPAAVMALARLDLPSLVLYGGSIMPGKFEGRDVTVQDVFEAVGACMAGLITPEQLSDLENVACPGAGACGGQFTANTMSTAITFLGISPMGANEIPALDPRRPREVAGRSPPRASRRGSGGADEADRRAEGTGESLVLERLRGASNRACTGGQGRRDGGGCRHSRGGPRRTRRGESSVCAPRDG